MNSVACMVHVRESQVSRGSLPGGMETSGAVAESRGTGLSHHLQDRSGYGHTELPSTLKVTQPGAHSGS